MKSKAARAGRPAPDDNLGTGRLRGHRAPGPCYRSLVQRIQFGGAESLAKVALRGGFGGTSSFIVPRFGTRCVCCNADAMGRVQMYDPSTDRVQAPPFAMPVCFDCKGHALQTATVPMLQACLLIVGGCLTGLGINYLRERPDDGFLKGMIGVGAAMTVAAIAWIFATWRRGKRERVPGHHPRLVFSVAHGRTLLDTANEELVVELLALNPSARVLPTPLLWRKARERRFPAARVVKAPPRAEDDEGARLAAYIAANPPVAPSHLREPEPPDEDAT